MKENLAPAVMHMHEDTTIMNERQQIVFKNGIITLYDVDRKKKRKNSSRHKAKSKRSLCFLFLCIWKLSHFSVR